MKRYVRCGNQGGETSTAAAMSGPTQAADHESDELVSRHIAVVVILHSRGKLCCESNVSV